MRTTDIIKNIKSEVVKAYAETTPTRSLVAYPRSIEECGEVIRFARSRGLNICPRGSGYTFGDMILNHDNVILNTKALNRIISWDNVTGRMAVEPGATYADIFAASLPDNWTLNACPGGMLVTMAGALANNVHGKDSWKKGNFCDQIANFKMMKADESIVTIDKECDKEMFRSVVGGMGLFGVVTEITLQLEKIPSAYVEVTNTPVRNIEESMDVLECSTRDNDYTISWVDAFARGEKLGRGFVTSARWIDMKTGLDRNRLKRSLIMPTRIFNVLPAKPVWYCMRPVFMPAGIKYLNKLNYLATLISSRISRLKKKALYTDYNFMHNKLPDMKYAFLPDGFLELQPMISRKSGTRGVREILELGQQNGFESMLCAIKIHKGDDQAISYSGDGYSIGWSIQLKGRDRGSVKKFAKLLFDYELSCGGKTFLAKDELLTVDIFKKMYPGYNEFVRLKKEVDPDELFSSNMYRRLIRPAGL